MQSVPLNNLQLSEINVRKTERDADIIGLAADIHERGLMQNLLVIPVPKKKGAFEVIAGGRRYLALQYLVETDRLAADFEVPIKVEAAEKAVESSLAENIQRVAMNPADEFTAFQTIIDQSEGTTTERIENCARRFGTTATHVRGRLRLAGLADTILDALRSNTITLASAMAYASVDDQDKQTAVFEKQSKSGWKPHDPDSVRQAMKDKTYTASDRVMKYIGRDAYVERGGRIDIDMFLLDQPERMIDTKLPDELVKERFKSEILALCEEHGFTDARLVDQSWSSPKVEGYQSQWASGPAFDKLKDSGVSMIGIFYLDGEGKPARGQNVMIPAEPVEPREPEAPRDWEAERAAETRRVGIQYHAFKRAFPKGAGTAFENRIYFPPRYPRFRDDQHTGDVFLEAESFFGREELQEHLAECGIAYDQHLADLAAAEEVKQAELQAALEQQETIRAELLAGDPPAVVRMDTDPEIFFLREDGRYWEQLPSDDPEDDNCLETADTLAELIDGFTVLAALGDARRLSAVDGGCRVSIELPRTDYGLILADPPWPFATYSGDGGTPTQKDGDDHYPVLSMDDLAALPVGDFAAKNCALAMWIVGSHIDVAIELGRSWGFTLKTDGFIWLKQKMIDAFQIDWMTDDIPPPPMSMGYFTRKGAEICLFFTRGKPLICAHDVRQVIVAPKREHSRKPDEQYPRLERLFGDVPRAELFCRTSRKGWDAWGNEVGKFEEVMA